MKLFVILKLPRLTIGDMVWRWVLLHPHLWVSSTDDCTVSTGVVLPLLSIWVATMSVAFEEVIFSAEVMPGTWLQVPPPPQWTFVPSKVSGSRNTLQMWFWTLISILLMAITRLNASTALGLHGGPICAVFLMDYDKKAYLNVKVNSNLDNPFRGTSVRWKQRTLILIIFIGLNFSQ